jgi:hypothetical protein
VELYRKVRLAQAAGMSNHKVARQISIWREIVRKMPEF